MTREDISKMLLTERKDKVSDHAVVRYLERDERQHKLRMVLNEILYGIENGVEVLPKDPVIKMLNHDYKTRRYVRSGNNVYVISEDGVVVTVLKWGTKEFRVKDK